MKKKCPVCGGTKFNYCADFGDSGNWKYVATGDYITAIFEIEDDFIIRNIRKHFYPNFDICLDCETAFT